MKISDEVLSILSKETQLTDLIECLQSGKLKHEPDEKITEDETVIGELTETEKALFSALEALCKKAEFIADENNEMVSKAHKNGEDLNEFQIFMNKSEYQATMDMGEALKSALWLSILKRIDIQACENDRVQIGIRKGNQLVSFNSTIKEIMDVFAVIFDDDDNQ